MPSLSSELLGSPARARPDRERRRPRHAPAADLPGVIEVDGGRVRRTDLDFLVSARARELVAEEGIVVIDHRPLQAAWARVSP